MESRNRKHLAKAVVWLFALLPQLVQAQHPPLHCPSDKLNDSLITHDPRWARSFFYMEQAIQAHNATPAEERSNEVYTLPVVVHVIHTGEAVGSGTNISDAQIHSAITALNEDFRRIQGTNGYGNGVDVGIEFCLAVRDPNGNPTTGIVRVNGSSVTNYATQGITAGQGQGADELAVKALSTWPRTSYVNIWVVNEIENNNGGSGIQGYAYFPFNNPKDGIVILYNAFGTVGTLKSYTNLNRTLTHEVGHYLGLYHTFHETSSCSSENNCSTQGDRVCDTPATTLNSSCSNPACSGTQQVQNYLDYTNQSCQNLFTDGQRTRMRATLESQRTSMTTSLGCQPVSVLDAGITGVLSPTGASCSDTHTPLVTLTNFGTAALTSVAINYNLNGTGLNTFNWSGNLTSGSSINVTLPAISVSQGLHTFYAWTSNPNGQSDENPSNNQATSDFEVSTGGQVTLVVTLDFFGAENTWRITNGAGIQVAQGGPYANNVQGTQHTHNLCLPTGCYTLTFFDSFGDGQGFINGGFVLYDQNNSVLASQSGNWGSQSNNPFCVTNTFPTGEPPVANFTISDAVVCTGQQISFTNTSTNSPTTYSWTFSGGSSGTSTQTNPSGISWSTPGTYTVALTATNAHGSHTYTCTNCITVIAGPSVNLVSTAPSCNGGSNGQITANVTGDYSPYTYLWSNQATTASISNLNAGTYSITVSNSEGCTAQASATLNAPAALAISGSPTHITCAGANNGSISVGATGGTGSKTFSWSNGASGASISGLSAGTYTVTATDQNGCSAQQSFTINSPSAIAVTGIPVHITCAGQNNGSISVSATGGTGNKTFTWSNGSSGTSLSGLSAGSYTVTATDQNGCTAQQGYTINAPAAIAITGSATNSQCGTPNGGVSVSASGGTGTITYTWLHGANGPVLSGLSAGFYQVTATDQNGCSAQETFVVISPSGIQLSLFSSDVSCAGMENGSVTAVVGNAVGEVNYSWSNGASGSFINGLSSGVYTVTVSDESGCTASGSVQVNAPTQIELNISTTPALCGTVGGTATAQVTGGSGSFMIIWSNGDTGTFTEGLAAGTHSVTVADASGCSITENFTINANAPLQIEIEMTSPSCLFDTDGSLTAWVSGGDGNYSYLWNTSSTGQTIGGLGAGNYTVEVTDGNGCQIFSNVNLTSPEDLQVLIFKSDITCYGMSDGTAVAIASGGTGALNISWSNGEEGVSMEGLSAGLHTVIVSDSNGCTRSETFEILEPQELILSAEVLAHESCDGNDGIAVAYASGGYGELEYEWSNLQSGPLAQGISSGPHTVIVSDENGCSVLAAVIVDLDCQVILPMTQLTDEFCDATGLAPTTIIECDPIPQAEQYQWRFGNLAGQGIVEVFTSTNTIPLNSLTEIETGVGYVVQVRARLGGQWAGYGGVCIISTADLPPLVTQLISSHCGTTITNWGQIVIADAIPGAINYEWNIVGPDYEWTSFTLTNEFMLNPSMLFTPGVTYMVRIRCGLGNGIYTEWGMVCPITFDPSIVANVEEMQNGESVLLFYPNPNNGQSISILFSGSLETSISEIKVFNVGGKLCEIIPLNFTGKSGEQVYHEFERRLAPGLYFLEYTHSNIRYCEKLTVN